MIGVWIKKMGIEHVTGWGYDKVPKRNIIKASRIKD